VTRTKTAAFLLTASALALGALAAPRDEVVRSFDKTLPLAAGRSFRLSHRLGNVRIQGGAAAEVRIHATIHASAETREESQKVADAIRIAIAEDSTGLSVETVYPDTSRTFLEWLARRYTPSYSVDYDITVPRTCPVTLSNGFGNVEASDLGTRVDVANAHGRLSVTDVTGDARVENKFGAAQVSRVGGALTVSNTNGAVVVSAAGGHVTVTNRFGDVSVAQARKGATVTNGNGTVSVTDSDGPLTVADSFGAVVVGGVKGNVTVINRNGVVELRGVSGAAEVTNAFGDVTVSDVGGRLGVVNANARVSVRGVKGSAHVRNGFGEIEVRDVRGDLDAHNGNAAVTVDDVGGSAEVRTSFGRIEVRQVGRGVKATNNNGDVVVADAGGPVYVKNSFGLVQADRVGSLRVENANGAVRASMVKGAADLQTSFASISLAGVEGDVTVRGQNGAADVSGLATSACHRLGVSTSFAPIRLTLPQDLGLSVSVRTSFGRIDSQVPITTTGVASKDSLVGTIGGGGCEVTVSNSNGSVTLVPAPRTK
jgi:hypothetical protein